MQALLDTAMRGGAMGMTTALIYPPSSYARTPELVEMAKVAAKYGGTYATHMRDEGKDLIQSIEEAIAIGERAGLPVEIFHLKAAYQPGWGVLMTDARRTIDAARARGRGRRGRSLCLYRGRHRARGDHSLVGAGRRTAGAARAAGGSADPRASQAGGRRRRSRVVQSRRSCGRLVRHRPRQRPEPRERTVRGQDDCRDRNAVEQGAGRRGVGSRGPGRAAA